MKKYLTFILFLGLISSATASTGSLVPAEDPKKGYVEPFRLFDNVYYVGDKWVSSYVIETSDGLILIDALESPYGRWIPGNIQKLGLDPAAIQYIVITHGHSDHLAGAQYLQSKYGSKVVMAAADLDLARQQAVKSRNDEYGTFTLPEFELVEEDGTVLTLGDTTLKLYLTPGHTWGSMSMEFFARADDNRYRAFIVGGMGTNFEGRDLAEKYLASVHRIRKLASETPEVQVNLANHPHMAQLFERRKRAVEEGSTAPYVDKQGFLQLLDILEGRGTEKMQQVMSGQSVNTQ